jgi:hypothetical protein
MNKIMIITAKAISIATAAKIVPVDGWNYVQSQEDIDDSRRFKAWSPGSWESARFCSPVRG